MSLLTNLTFYARLNEASNDRHDLFGNTGLDVNGVLSAAGIRGTAAAFVAASSQFLNWGTGVMPGGNTTSWTITGWLRFDDTTDSGSGQEVLNKDGSSLRCWHLARPAFGTTGLNFRLYNGVSTVVNGATGVAATMPAQPAWFFIEFGFDKDTGTFGTSFVKINNGAAVTAALTATHATNNATVRMGNRQLAGGGYFNGRMQLVSYHTRLLTAAESSQLYNSGAGFVIQRDSSASSPGRLHALLRRRKET